jgi:hypothetical protein
MHVIIFILGSLLFILSLAVAAVSIYEKATLTINPLDLGGDQ